MKLVTIVGARPQFVKAQPVCRAIAEYNQLPLGNDARIHEVLVHTGQHYDYEMSQAFFESLQLPTPAYHLGVGSGSHGWQTGEILRMVEEVLDREKPDAVIVFGDTNSTLAGALAAAKLHIPVAHVEAGLRSFNRRMPEELNRILTDHISTLLFAPTETAVQNLRAEGITRGVYLVGDVMHEAAMEHVLIATRKSTILKRLGLEPRAYSLATVHRAENTDTCECLRSIVEAFLEIGQKEVIVWPVHPRTRKNLKEFRLDEICKGHSSPRMLSPVSYLDMLQLEGSARIILTDSGGVQKESRWFHVPCVTLRRETEWIETVEEGWNRLAGNRKESIVEAFACAMRTDPDVLPRNGQRSQAAATIVNALAGHAQDLE